MPRPSPHAAARHQASSQSESKQRTRTQRPRIFECPSESCPSCFTSRKNAWRHIQTKHKGEQLQALAHALPKSSVVETCKHCSNTFGSQSSLARHVKKQHPEKQEHKFGCDYCDLRFPKMKGALSHMKKNHAERLQQDEALVTKTFASDQDFHCWLEEVQNAHSCNYGRQTASASTGGTSTCGYGPPVPVTSRVRFVCTCNESPRPGPAVRRRKTRKQPKAMGHCRARAYAEWTSDCRIIVDLYTRHSHDMDVRHRSNPSAVRCWATREATRGVTDPDIYRKLPDVFPGCPRAALVTYNDVYNITRGCDEAVLARTDGASLMQRAALTNRGGEVTIIALKFQGEETFRIGAPVNAAISATSRFLAIIQTPWQRQVLKTLGKDAVYLDATHQTNRYAFPLTTIVVKGTYGGIPVGHMICDSEAHCCLVQFLQTTIKDIDVWPRAIVTDDDLAEHCAIKTVFGTTTRHLLCQFHILKNWEHVLLQKLGVEGRERARTPLRIAMLQATPEDFEIVWTIFVRGFSSNPEFLQYMHKRYYERKHKWADAFERQSRTTTNNYVESFHRSFKKINLKARANSRLDRLVWQLMAYEKQIRRKETQQFLLGKPTYVESCAAFARQRAASVVVLAVDSNKIKVRSQSTPTSSYTVTHLPVMACEHCHGPTCVHRYVCECLAFKRAESPRLCKHTAAVFRHLHGAAVNATPQPRPHPQKRARASASKDVVKAELETVTRLVDSAPFLPPALIRLMREMVDLLEVQSLGVKQAPTVRRDAVCPASVWQGTQPTIVKKTKRRKRHGGKRNKKQEDERAARVYKELEDIKRARARDTSTVPQGRKGQGGRPPGDTSTVPQGRKGQGGRPPGHGRAGPRYSPSVLLLQRDMSGYIAPS